MYSILKELGNQQLENLAKKATAFKPGVEIDSREKAEAYSKEMEIMDMNGSTLGAKISIENMLHLAYHIERQTEFLESISISLKKLLEIAETENEIRMEKPV